MKCAVLLAALVLNLAVSDSDAMPPPPQCTPGIIEEIPLRMRKVCAALSTIYELSNAMESYLDEKGGVYQQSKCVCTVVMYFVLSVSMKGIFLALFERCSARLDINPTRLVENIRLVT